MTTEKNVQIGIFKQQAVRWINTRADQLLGDGFAGKMLRPLLDEVIDRYSQDKGIDAFLSMFVDDAGDFNIDRLLDRYIELFTENGGIKFRWGDIAPIGSILDKINGNKINVITAGDIKALKDAFLEQVAKQK